MENTKQV